jgi:hypothetical protein
MRIGRGNQGRLLRTLTFATLRRAPRNDGARKTCPCKKCETEGRLLQRLLAMTALVKPVLARSVKPKGDCFGVLLAMTAARKICHCEECEAERLRTNDECPAGKQSPSSHSHMNTTLQVKV